MLVREIALRGLTVLSIPASFELDGSLDVIIDPAQDGTPPVCFRSLEVVDGDVSRPALDRDFEERTRHVGVPVVGLVLVVRPRGDGVPSGTGKDRARERVDEVVCRRAVGLDLAEVRELVRLVGDAEGWDSEERGPRSSRLAVGVLPVDARVGRFPQPLAGEQRGVVIAEVEWRGGLVVADEDGEIRFESGSVPDLTNLRLEVRDEGVGQDLVPFRIGENRIQEVRLSDLLRVEKVLLVKETLDTVRTRIEK